MKEFLEQLATIAEAKMDEQHPNIWAKTKIHNNDYPVEGYSSWMNFKRALQEGFLHPKWKITDSDVNEGISNRHLLLNEVARSSDILLWLFYNVRIF